ncbi:hypothetical protein ACWELJ_21275 [Nocardia sp. NPDC004582]
MSAVRFTVPANWSNLVDRDMTNLWCEAETLGDALRWLAAEFPTLANRILTEAGTIPRYAAVAIDDVRVSASESLDKPFPAAQHEVCVISAFMGG